MKIDLSEVVLYVNKSLDKEVTIEMTTFSSKMGNFQIIDKKPFILHLSNEEDKQLFIRTDLDVILEIPCDRCLTAVPVKIHLSVDKAFMIDNSQLIVEEEDDYVNGFNLDIDKLIYGEILVHWPMKVLCKTDCKGICKNCGANLNEKTCDCQKTELDPRMAAIQDIFNKFKEV